MCVCVYQIYIRHVSPAFESDDRSGELQRALVSALDWRPSLGHTVPHFNHELKDVKGKIHKELFHKVLSLGPSLPLWFCFFLFNSDLQSTRSGYYFLPSSIFKKSFP